MACTRNNSTIEEPKSTQATLLAMKTMLDSINTSLNSLNVRVGELETKNLEERNSSRRPRSYHDEKEPKLPLEEPI